LTPIYPTTAGLTQARLRPLIEDALARAQLDDTLPEDVRRRLGLCDFREAVDSLHHPRPGADPAALGTRTLPAWKRMKFDELLAQQLSMRKHYLERKARRAPVLEPPAEKRAASPLRLSAVAVPADSCAAADLGEIERDLAQPTRCIACCRAMSAAARR